MVPLDILYLALALGFLVIVGYASYTLLQVAKTLKEIQPILEDIRSIIEDIQGLKDSAKNSFSTVLALVQSVAGMRGAQTNKSKVKK